MRYGVKHKNKYESVNKYTSKEKLDMFNVIDKKFNIWGNKDDPIQKTLDEKVMAPSIKNFDQNKKNFQVQKEQISKIHARARQVQGGQKTLRSTILLRKIDKNNQKYDKCEDQIHLAQQSLITNENANQKYHAVFERKIKAWQQNEIK